MKTERISIATCYDIDKVFDSDKFIKLRLRLCHDGKNPAGSNFSSDSLKNAADSIKNIPILAYVVASDDKGLDFKAHDMAFEKNILSDEKDDFKLIYKETPIGLIPEDCNYAVEEVDGKLYAFADGYIWKDYSNYAQDIIERDGTKNLSMEAIIDELDEDTDTNEYIVTNFRYKGVTLLGDNIKTGMLNAKATVETFGTDIYEQITKMVTELKFALDNQKKEVINEMNDENKVTTVPEANTGDTATFADNTSTEDTNVSGAVTDNTTAQFDDNSATDATDTQDDTSDDTANFALSHEDIRRFIYCELNKRGIDAWVGDVFDTMFEYKPYGSDENIEFRQNYSVVDDKVVFDGEAETIYLEKLTEAEKAELEATRAGKETELEELRMSVESLKTENLALTEFKQGVEKAQADAARNEVIAKWSTLLANNADFSALTAGDISEFSAEDLDVKCKVIFADANAKFSAETTKPENSIVRFALGDNSDAKENNQPYGGLFAEFGKNNI